MQHQAASHVISIADVASQTTVERVKERLRSHTGTAVDSMRLELFDQNNGKLAVLSDEWRPLGYYSPTDG